MKLNDFNFGYADASKEYAYYKKMFDVSFHDPFNFIDKLINGHKYLVVGRKGVGKTAILSKIKSITDKEQNSSSITLNLAEFQYSRFKKLKVGQDITGSNKYKVSWELLLLLKIVKHLYEKLEVENDNLINIVSTLEDIGINIESTSLEKDIKFLSKVKLGGELGLKLVKLNGNIDLQKTKNEKDYWENVNEINEYLIKSLMNLYFPDKKYFLLLDGLDDILRIKIEQQEIIKSLIRCIDELNIKFLELPFKVKIILSIREDIMNELTDPDMNKIKRDGALNVDWRSKHEELQELVIKRLKYSGITTEEAREFMNTLLPSKVRKKSAWDYMLDRTLYKPRDILQFFKTCQEEFPEYSYLTSGNIKDATKNYSSYYLIQEMKDELSGFIKDEYIMYIPDVFKSIGDRNFNLHRFKDLLDEALKPNNISIEEAKKVMNLLYNAGYIGQLITNFDKSKTSVNFKYRNPNSRFDYRNNFIIHTGIKAGLEIAL
ncbi:P-loop ATPase, Sll1717 family [Mammaliicoccus sciuri]|uniref:P-loop ATPase, Sll1717 family n=1 Tax=Mammaliicoccus sciuri TaxID=1296 RepID=UPI001FB2E65A|nr:hypothetical protein [Mammaliicoccus sciuri]MCJ1776313.1 hypothetical protein [Mammaliicoccus sciuri]